MVIKSNVPLYIGLITGISKCFPFKKGFKKYILGCRRSFKSYIYIYAGYDLKLYSAGVSLLYTRDCRIEGQV